ncbi:MAG: hypothetical protein KGM99_15400 [Burkholderiales bacterium]|nr:hypothetical protein [Burkholderiales bacterium]
MTTPLPSVKDLMNQIEGAGYTDRFMLDGSESIYWMNLTDVIEQLHVAAVEGQAHRDAMDSAARVFFVAVVGEAQRSASQ